VINLDGRLRLHPDFRHTVQRVGREQAPVLVVDDFLADPGVLIDVAEQDATFDAVTDTFYPGIRAPLPAIYRFAVRAFLGNLIAGTFGLGERAVARELGHFSLVTTPPARLTPLQRQPHVDSADPLQLAVLHYLCDATHGGTSFYRHRGTGFESIDAARIVPYGAALRMEGETRGPPPSGYIRGDDAGFERTASFEAAFNRVLVYRSITLHSPDIAPAASFDARPRSGRLTANTFFFYR